MFFVSVFTCENAFRKEKKKKLGSTLEEKTSHSPLQKRPFNSPDHGALPEQDARLWRLSGAQKAHQRDGLNVLLHLLRLQEIGRERA